MTSDAQYKTALFKAPISEKEFLRVFGDIYEHSPWVASTVWPDICEGKIQDFNTLTEAMRTTVESASDQQKMTLICAHPELAGRAAIAGTLTKASTSEQAGAGLDQCTPEEFESFTRLNADYSKRFGFPFIIAVKGHNRTDILKAFESRLENSREAEIETALLQIHKIAYLRLAAVKAEFFS